MLIYGINALSVVLILIFLLPIVFGAFGELSRERVRYSMNSLLDNIEFICAILLSIYFTKKIFFEHDVLFFKTIYNAIPNKIKQLLFEQDILAYIIFVPIILLLILVALRLITTPLYNYIIAPIADFIYSCISSMNRVLKKLIGALWQLPRAITLTLVFAFVLNFSMYYLYIPTLSKWMNDSGVYQLIYNNVMYPVLNSNIAKRIPVLVNDTFKNATGVVIPIGDSQTAETIEKYSGGKIRVIEYFNGVTIDEAVKSNKQIDDTAKTIIGNAADDKEKAYLLYKWVSKNIKYDYDKAEKIVSKPKDVTSGSIPAFETRKGICFDFSCLYISMCRAVNLKVRLVTGIGYSGLSWGDHAWNQVYYPGENRWINVDCTFGSTGINYFDKSDFNVDHKNEDIQAEW